MKRKRPGPSFATRMAQMRKRLREAREYQKEYLEREAREEREREEYVKECRSREEERTKKERELRDKYFPEGWHNGTDGSYDYPTQCCKWIRKVFTGKS